ncbi:MAG: hypothetical protein AAFY66_17840 [Pseudomonadota bacterium]
MTPTAADPNDPGRVPPTPAESASAKDPWAETPAVEHRTGGEMPREAIVPRAPIAGLLPLDPATGRAHLSPRLLAGTTWRAEGHVETVRAAERRVAALDRARRGARPTTFRLDD